MSVFHWAAAFFAVIGFTGTLLLAVMVAWGLLADVRQPSPPERLSEVADTLSFEAIVLAEFRSELAEIPTARPRAW